LFVVKEDKVDLKKVLITLAHALVGWALCFATIGIGRAVTSMETTLIVHAVGAPVYFFIISLVYFNKFNYFSPLITGLIFTGFIIVVDFFIVALLINQSLEMFASLLGTWIPFGLIFASTYLTGLYVIREDRSRDHAVESAGHS
jgi:hypothetical protein